MFRDRFYIGVEFLYLLIHRRADQTCSQQPGVPLPRQGERRLSEDHPCGVLPVDHLRQPIEQQRRRVHIAPFNRALPSPRHRRRVRHTLKERLRRAAKDLLDRFPFGFKGDIGQGNLFKKSKRPGHGRQAGGVARRTRRMRAWTSLSPGSACPNGLGIFPLSNILMPRGRIRKRPRGANPTTFSGMIASFKRPCCSTRSVKPRTWRAPPVFVNRRSSEARRNRMIASMGLTSFGQTSTQKLQRVQSQIPCSSWSAESLARVAEEDSRGSERKRSAFANAAGPANPFETSCTVQAATQAPHMMQASTL